MLKKVALNTLLLTLLAVSLCAHAEESEHNKQSSVKPFVYGTLIGAGGLGIYLVARSRGFQIVPRFSFPWNRRYDELKRQIVELQQGQQAQGKLLKAQGKVLEKIENTQQIHTGDLGTIKQTTAITRDEVIAIGQETRFLTRAVYEALHANDKSMLMRCLEWLKGKNSSSIQTPAQPTLGESSKQIERR